MTGQEPRAPLGARPRLSDWYDLPLDEQTLEFAVPRLYEDVPLSLDPFLLFNSPKIEYQQLHDQLLAFMETVRLAVLADRHHDALRLLEGVNEPVELGLGYGAETKKGRAFGPQIRNDIVALYASVPQLLNSGLTHVEALGLLVDNVAEDRISDLTGSVIRRFLADFSTRQATTSGLPTARFPLDNVWDPERSIWRADSFDLPFNPLSGAPLLLAPRDLLRALPFINYNDYYSSTYAPLVLPARVKGKRPKPLVLEHNRRQYAHVDLYITSKEECASECRPRELFKPLTKPTLVRKLSELRKLPTGKEGGADKQYEALLEAMLPSLLSPELDFAQPQSRTLSGAHIRDLIFYNDAKTPFTGDLRRDLEARQVVIEIKNVASLSGEHFNQLSRYLIGPFGRFGVIVTRSAPSRAMQQNAVDLYSSQRKQIVCLTDDDIGDMVDCVGSGRRPMDIIKRSCVRFERQLPN